MKLLRIILSLITTLLFSFSLIATGYLAVALPDLATFGLSQAFSGCDQPDTPYTRSELVSMALAGKHYTFDTNNLDELNSAINEANTTAVASNRSSEADTHSYRQSMDAESISHLNDVYQVASIAKPALLGTLLVCALCLLVVGYPRNKRSVGRILIASGVLVLALFASFGAWAAIDFYGMFNTLHSLFFSAGTWTFEMDSLLITLYPTAFWMGMGAIWLAVSCVLSILSIIIGKKLRKKSYVKHAK